MGWLALHLVYIVGFRSRLSTIIDWAVAFSTWGRSQLTVTEQQVYARTAMDHLHHLEAANKLDEDPLIRPSPSPTPSRRLGGRLDHRRRRQGRSPRGGLSVRAGSSTPPIVRRRRYVRAR